MGVGRGKAILVVGFFKVEKTNCQDDLVDKNRLSIQERNDLVHLVNF